MSNTGGSGNRKKGGGSGGGSGAWRGGPPSTAGAGSGQESSQSQSQSQGQGQGQGQGQSLAGVVGAMPKKTKDLHRTAFLLFLQKITGVVVDLHLVDGRIMRGVLHTATPFHGKKFELALKGVTALNAAGVVVEDPSIEVASTALFAFTDIKTLTVPKKNVADKEAAQQDFETDSSVGRRTDLRELEGRDLQSVGNSWLAPETSTSLETGARGGIGKWNQFEANQRLYNVQNTYDENLYTKKLDKSNLTKEQLKKADKVARSIETTTSNNIVLREDRGQLEGEDFNEEDMFSGVVRPTEGGKGRSKGEGKQPAGPQGAWKRGFNLPGNNSSSADAKVDNGSPKGGKVSGSPSGKSSPSGNAVGAWSSKASKDSASALLASSVGVGSVSNTNTNGPPGLSSSPPPGLTQSKATVAEEEEEPNISFYADDDDGEIETTSEKKEEKKVEEAKKKVGEEKTIAAPPTTTTALRATATEWKPNASAAVFVPGGVTTAVPPAAEKKQPSPMTGGKGKGKGQGNKGGNRNNNNNNNHNNMHHNQMHSMGGSGMNYPMQGYPQHMAYMSPMVGAGGVQSFAPPHPAGMYQHPQMIGQQPMIMQQHPGGGAVPYYVPPQGMGPARGYPSAGYMGGPGGPGSAMYDPYSNVGAPLANLQQLQPQAKTETPVSPEQTKE